MNSEDPRYYEQLATEPYTWGELAITVGLIALVILELLTIDTWCKWFTNCP